MMNSRNFRRAAAAAGLAAVLFGCGRQPETGRERAVSAQHPLPPSPRVAACEPGTPGGRLVLAGFGDPKTFNPITENESSSREIIRLLFSSLVHFDWPSQTVEPGLLESWEVDKDQKTWTLKLRPGLKWSDGQPLTADDVLFTWNDVIYNPAVNNVMIDVFRVEGKNFTVTKSDERTIRVVTPEVFAPFLENLDNLMVLPKHVLARAVAERRFEAAYGINARPNEVVGSGPFVLKQFKPGQFTLLERNPEYWVVDKKGRRLPYFDQLIYMVVPDWNAMSLRFLKGETDIQEDVRPEEAGHFKEKAGEGAFVFHELGLDQKRLFIWFNLNTNASPVSGKPYVDPVKLKWFRNSKFRQAISLSIDRPSIIKSIFGGHAEPAFGFESPVNKKWFNPNIRPPSYDPAAARRMLAEIGIRDRNGDGFLEDESGNKIEFVFNTNTGNTVREKMAVLIQDDLKKLGIQLIYQPLEFNTLIDKLDNSYDYECALLGLGGGSTDPSSSLNVLRSDGFTHFWFPRQKTPSFPWEARIDRLMNDELKTLDFAERKKSYDEVQTIMAEEMPLIYLVSPLVYAAHRKDLANVRQTALSNWRISWNPEELYFRK